MSTTDEIEQKLNQALQLLQEAQSALGELRRSDGPAQVMSRIQGAQAMRASPLALVPHRKSGRERAAFYLHIESTANPANDKILRVLGDGGLIEADRIETELKKDQGYRTERWNSRQYQAVVETRMMQVRQGASNVGALKAEDLRGVQQ